MTCNYIYGSMCNREQLSSAILASVPAIGVATFDEPTFMNFLTNMFYSTAPASNVMSILRWSIPSGLLCYRADSIHSIRISRPSPNGIPQLVPIDSMTALTMIRKLEKERDQLSIVNIDNEQESLTVNSFFQERRLREGNYYIDPWNEPNVIREGAILVLPDFHKVWHDPAQLRCLKETIVALEGSGSKVILTFPPGTEVPVEIQTQLYVSNFDSPDINEFENLVYFWLKEQAAILSNKSTDRYFRNYGINISQLVEDNDIRDITDGRRKGLNIASFLNPEEMLQDPEGIDRNGNRCWTPLSITRAISNLAQALTGLSWTEAYHTLIMAFQKSEALSVYEVQQSKITYLNTHAALSVQSPDTLPSFADVGGYESIKNYISRHMAMFTPENRQRACELGLSPFKGCLLIGIPGTGKSLVAKATGRESNMLVCDLDIGKVMDKYVGGSESNMRQVLEKLEKAAGNHGVLVLMDEIEKQLAGSKNSGASDAGATSRVHKNFLSWLNDRTKPVIIFMTANNIDEVPTEFFRPGRVDAVFFFDLPSAAARMEILRVHLSRYPAIENTIDIERIATELLQGFTGAEIEQLIKECVTAILHGESDIIDNALIQRIIPTMKLQCNTHREKIRELRQKALEFRLAEEPDDIGESEVSRAPLGSLRHIEIHNVEDEDEGGDNVPSSRLE